MGEDTAAGDAVRNRRQFARKICVVGLGYIGLPTAAMFASRKIEVVGVDVNQNTVDTINRGDVHIVEPDLDIVVQAAVSGGYLRATTVPEPAESFIIAVPTPFLPGNHEPDLRYVEAASKTIAPVLTRGNLVILESTCPVGATEQMAAWLAQARPDLSFPQDAGDASDIRIAHCPERVLPGRVMQELIHNDRVIGGMTRHCAEEAVKLYGHFVEADCVITDARTAELAKLTENSFRDVNIAFANELSMVCDRLGVNVWELVALANRHPRVNILQPGPGVGGHCIAVDPWFIVAAAPEEARLIRTARTVNDSKPQWVIDKVEQAVARWQAGTGVPEGHLRIACYGLAFKPDIDDLRESPALAITQALAARYPGRILAVEPNIEALPAGLDGVTLVDIAGAADAGVHVLLVDHGEFRAMAPPGGELVDSRGLWS